MPKRNKNIYLALLIILFLMPEIIFAHHVLGRPSYNLSEDSNTPPSMQIETQVGDYFINFAAFPAFPDAGEAGRVNFYAVHNETNQPPQTTVEFKVRDDSWFTSNKELLGVQEIDDGVYRQGFVFQKDGAYIISAYFHDGKAPYTIDFPIRIGRPPAFGPLGITIGLIVFMLITINIIQRRRLQLRKNSSPQESEK